MNNIFQETVIDNLFENDLNVRINYKLRTFDNGEIQVPLFVHPERVAIFFKEKGKSIDLKLATALCKINVIVLNLDESEKCWDSFKHITETKFKERSKLIESYYPDDVLNQIDSYQNYYPKNKKSNRTDREEIEFIKKNYPKGSKLAEKLLKYYTPDSTGFSQADRDRVIENINLRKWQLKIEGFKAEDLDKMTNTQIMNLHQQVISSRCLEPQDDIDGDYDEKSVDNA